MDATDAPNGSRSTLRQPFIDTANALASLYKQAISAERDARDAGSRAAYMRIMEWVARKSRAAERITPAELIAFCSAELAALPQSAPPPPARGDPEHAQGPTQQHAAPQQFAPQAPAPPVAYIPRDDPLVSDIRKLHVNPRKRQRVDISDTFVSACRDADSDALIFAPDGYALLSRDNPDESPLFRTDSMPRPPSTGPPRRESRDAPLITANPNDYSTRRGKHSKSHSHEKPRRK